MLITKRLYSGQSQVINILDPKAFDNIASFLVFHNIQNCRTCAKKHNYSFIHYFYTIYIILQYSYYLYNIYNISTILQYNIQIIDHVPRSIIRITILQYCMNVFGYIHTLQTSIISPAWTSLEVRYVSKAVYEYDMP